MQTIKITAIRKTEYPDLMQEYENPITHTCDIMVGQTYLVKDCQKPDGLCDSAWQTLLPFVEELSQGGGNFFDGWMKNPYSAMLSCNDGFRPVSFLVEVVDDKKNNKPLNIKHTKSLIILFFILTINHC